MSDLFQQLSSKKNRKVKEPRTNDGFVDSRKTLESASSNSNQSNVKPTQPTSQSNTDSDVPPWLVETAKPKLLTLEIQLRQELDLLLYENSDVSWDTVLEAALISGLFNPDTKEKIIQLAQERLAARRKTSVYKRSKTMAKNMLNIN